LSRRGTRQDTSAEEKRKRKEEEKERWR